MAFELTDWEALAQLSHRLGLSLRVISDTYHNAIATADQLFRHAAL